MWYFQVRWIEDPRWQVSQESEPTPINSRSTEAAAGRSSAATLTLTLVPFTLNVIDGEVLRRYIEAAFISSQGSALTVT